MLAQNACHSTWHSDPVSCVLIVSLCSHFCCCACISRRIGAPREADVRNIKIMFVCLIHHSKIRSFILATMSQVGDAGVQAEPVWIGAGIASQLMGALTREFLPRRRISKREAESSTCLSTSLTLLSAYSNSTICYRSCLSDSG